jgi:hypothetical protein
MAAMTSGQFSNSMTSVLQAFSRGVSARRRGPNPTTLRRRPQAGSPRERWPTQDRALERERIAALLERLKNRLPLRRREVALQLANKRLLLRRRQRIEELHLLAHRDRDLGEGRTGYR